MNIKKYLIQIVIAGKPARPVAWKARTLLRYSGQYLLFAVLYGCSLVYQIVVQFRLFLYQQGWLKRTTLPCPVISIGNISTGGTGKTPMVIRVAQMLRQRGKRVVILSRGYSGSAGIPAGQSPGSAGIPAGIVNASSDVRQTGDEPLLIARILRNSPESPDITVIVGRQRSITGKWAIEHLQPDVILLDDGFQHIQLERTCDIVLIDATNPFGGDYLLPAGFLREPLRNLSRAGAFVITRSAEVADITPIRRRLNALNPQAPIFTAQHRFDGIRNAITGETVEPAALTQQPLLAVSGLGNPASFHRLLNELGLTAIHTLDFPDHHWYTARDIDAINRILREHEPAAIVTTEKDEVKLLPYADRLDTPVYALKIAMHVELEQEFETLIMDG